MFKAERDTSEETLYLRVDIIPTWVATGLKETFSVVKEDAPFLPSDVSHSVVGCPRVCRELSSEAAKAAPPHLSSPSVPAVLNVTSQ